MNSEHLKTIEFVHFNDVYQIQSELLPCFSQKFNHLKSSPAQPLVVFSGDAFSPSLETCFFKGKHMVDVLNLLNVDIATYGNHDFDLGIEQLNELSDHCQFPFVLANLVDSHGIPLARAKPFHIFERHGIKIGFFGLAGSDYDTNCQHLPSGFVIKPPYTEAEAWAHYLRHVENVDLVVAITHMRSPEDIVVAKVPGIDLVLGGHDHIVYQYNGSDGKGPMIVKSGTDFQHFSEIKIHLFHHPKGNVEILERKVILHSVSKHEAANEAMVCLVNGFKQKLCDVGQKPLLYSSAILEVVPIRERETALGNFIADTLRYYYNADIALVNSGCLRGTSDYQGVLSIADIMSVSPFQAQLVVRQIKGSNLLKAIENSVSDKRSDGRFMQVSGLYFEVDFNAEELQRVKHCSIVFDNSTQKNIEEDKTYSVVISSFISEGFDGYDMLVPGETILGQDKTKSQSQIIIEVFSGEEHDDPGILRARRWMIKEYLDGLPVIHSHVEERIHVRNHDTLSSSL